MSRNVILKTANIKIKENYMEKYLFHLKKTYCNLLVKVIGVVY